MPDPIIERISNNAQATHQQVAVSSIGKAVLTLFNHYRLSDDASFELLYNECFHQLSNLTPEDFIKELPPQQDEALRALAARQNEALLHELRAQLGSLITFIKARTIETIDPNLDTAIIYRTIVNEQGEEVGVRESYVLPLKQVFPLVYKALTDDAAFAHQYKGTPDKPLTPEEQLEAAKQDRPQRLLSLLRCLQRARQGLCHTGVRNELVSLLNGTYKGITIIEDAAATTNYFLKERIPARLRAFLTRLHPDSPDASNVLEAVYLWMSSANVLSLLEIIDPQKTIQAELIEFFKQNGSDPSENIFLGSNLNHLIEKTYRELTYPIDSKNDMLFSMVASIFASPERDLPLREQALERLQAWLRTHFKINTPPQVIAPAYTLIKMHMNFLKSKDLLLFSGQMTSEDIKLLERDFATYYEELLQLPQDKRSLPPVSRDLLLKLTDLEKAIKAAQKDSSESQIANFFAAWFVAKAEHNKKQSSELYKKIMLNPSIWYKISCPDSILNQWNQTINLDGVEFQDVTPYQINRIFLHALITNLAEWTPAFANTLKMILSFVENPLAENSYLGLKLKEDSYPRQLTEQLNYLFNSWYSLVNPAAPQPESRPKDMLLRPNQIRTVEEWVTCFTLLNKEEQHSLYQKQKVLFKWILSSCTRLTFDQFKTLYLALPLAEISSFIQTLTESNIEIIKIPNHSLDLFIEELNGSQLEGAFEVLLALVGKCDTENLITIMSSINLESQHKGRIWEKIKPNIAEKIKQGEDFLNIMGCLPEINQRLEFYELIQNSPTRVYWSNEEIVTVLKLPHVTGSSTPEEAAKIYSCVDFQRLTFDNCIKIFKKIQSLEQKHQFYVLIKSYLPQLITTVNEFYTLLSRLDVKDSEDFCTSMTPFILDNIVSIQHLPDRKIDSSTEQFSLVWNIVKNNITIQTREDLMIMLWHLNGRLLEEFYINQQVALADIIQNAQDISLVIFSSSSFPTTKREGFYAVLNLPNILKNAEGLQQVLGFFNEIQLKQFCMAMKGRFKSNISDTHGYITSISRITVVNREIFAKEVHDEFYFWIKSVEDANVLLSKYPDEEQLKLAVDDALSLHHTEEKLTALGYEAADFIIALRDNNSFGIKTYIDNSLASRKSEYNLRVFDGSRKEPQANELLQALSTLSTHWQRRINNALGLSEKKNLETHMIGNYADRSKS